MALRKYRTKNGIRYAVEVYRDGIRINYQAGFTSKLAALEWEKTAKNSMTPPDALDSLRDVCAAFLLDREKRVKPNTLSYKKTVLKRFIEFIGPKYQFSKIGKSQIESFLDEICGDITPVSANKHHIELSSLWTWAIKKEIVSENFPQNLEPYSVEKPVKYIPPVADVKKVLAAAEPGFEYDFLIAILHTAGRISEIRTQPWADVDMSRRTVLLWTSKRKGGNREARRLAMSDTLYKMYQRRYSSRPDGQIYVFTDPQTGTAYTRTCNRIKYLFQDLCLRAGVTHFGAHALRHYLATHFPDVRKAQKILGHKHLKTTEIYLHDLGVDREAADVFEGITHKITHEEFSGNEKGATFLQ